MSYSGIGSVSGCSNIAFPPLKQWRDCHELHEKIACIVANTKLIVGYYTSQGYSILANSIKSVVQISQLTSIAKYFLEHMHMLSGSINRVLNSIDNIFENISFKVNKTVDQLGQKTWQRLPLDQIFRCAKSTLTALEKTLTHCFKFTKSTFTDAFCQSLSNLYIQAVAYLNSNLNSLASLLGRSIAPYANKMLNTIDGWIYKIFNNMPSFEMRGLKEGLDGFSRIASNVIKPLNKHVISPVCTTLGKIGYGILHGCCRAPEEEDLKDEDHKLKKQ